jgi:hypothetical protein
MTQFRKRSMRLMGTSNALPFHTSHAIEALHGGFQSMMRQPPGGIHGAEV